MRLTFLGAVGGCITGSRSLVETNNGSRVLIDCGLSAESDKASDDSVLRGHSAKQRDDLFLGDVTPSSINAICITHGHTDHAMACVDFTIAGFSGNYYGTAPTLDITKALIDAHHNNDDGTLTKTQFARPVPYYIPQTLTSDVRGRFIPSMGHILGSSSVYLDVEEDGTNTTIAFSGDLGNINKTMLNNDADIQEADIAVVESTYGDRENHTNFRGALNELYSNVHNIYKRGGIQIATVLSIEKAQEVLYYLNKGLRERLLPRNLEIILDSPLSKTMTGIFNRFMNRPEYFSNEFLTLIENGFEPFAYKTEPKSSNYILLVTGGLDGNYGTLHRHGDLLEDERNGLTITSHVIPGSTLANIRDGKPARIGGEIIIPNAEPLDLNGFSSHADQSMIINWLKATKAKRIFIVHGTEKSRKELREAIQRQITGAQVTIPDYRDSFELSKDFCKQASFSPRSRSQLIAT